MIQKQKLRHGKLMIVVILLFLVGCDLFSSRPTEKVYISGEIIYQEDFEDTQSGWTTWKSEDGSFVDYQGGGMRIFINIPQYDYWSITKGNLSNVRLEVEAVNIGTVNDNSYGLICRYRDEKNFYAAVISSDGYAGIFKVREGVYQSISGETMTFSENLQTGMAVNDLRVDCIGSRLTLFVNGQEVISAEDGDFVSGGMGVIAGSTQQAGVDIFFDNFIVIQP
jgi:hypothetical protein